MPNTYRRRSRSSPACALDKECEQMPCPLLDMLCVLANTQHHIPFVCRSHIALDLAFLMPATGERPVIYCN